MSLGLFVTIMRMSRAPKDDPRMSRGLQLLQSKISVLEDLSDRTEIQVGQLTAILEQKCREVQAKVQLADQHVHAIRVSMDRSLEVAKIFQDKIPHQEIIERQNTIKYVQAARLAHRGVAAEEIAKQVDLPKGEIEFISKVNRERLMFNEDQLPTWAQARADLERESESSEVANPQAMPSSQVRGESQGELALTDTFAAISQPDSVAFSERDENFNAGRLRAEMELAEHQRLVDNLSRLQFEMHNLDAQLAKEAKESSHRDRASAFDVPAPTTPSLTRLGEEFRKACEAAQPALSPPPASGHANQAQNHSPNHSPNHAGATHSAFPPLETLAALIPKLMPIETNEDEQMSKASVSGIQAVPLDHGKEAVPLDHGREAAVPDAEKARAAAAAKVQAALRSSAQSISFKGSSASADGQENQVRQDELEAARALAREAAAGLPAHGANSAPGAGPSSILMPGHKAAHPAAVGPQKIFSQSKNPNPGPPNIRRVEFPKIDR